MLRLNNKSIAIERRTLGLKSDENRSMSRNVHQALQMMKQASEDSTSLPCTTFIITLMRNTVIRAVSKLKISVPSKPK